MGRQGTETGESCTRADDGLPLIGAHVSTAGSLATSIARASHIGAEAIQVFPSNARQWRPAPYPPGELVSYGLALQRERLPLFVHSIYLINLAAPDPDLRRKSAASLADALLFGALAGAAAVVTHVGSHRGDGFEAGLARVAQSLAETYEVLERRLAQAVEMLDAEPASAVPTRGDVVPFPTLVPTLLLESSAGGGDSMGRDPGELGRLLAVAPERAGICVDTAHLYAAGYALGTPAGLERLHDELAAAGCLDRVGLVHLNDSKTTLGSRSDRHENLWDGQYGRSGLRNVMRSAHLRASPFVMEVPGADGHGTDRRNIRRARIIRREAMNLTLIRAGV
ncbi:MAG: deoxyribonuclease IV [Thermoleophilia bacterium]